MGEGGDQQCRPPPHPPPRHVQGISQMARSRGRTRLPGTMTTYGGSMSLENEHPWGPAQIGEEEVNKGISRDGMATGSHVLQLI